MLMGLKVNAGGIAIHGAKRRETQHLKNQAMLAWFTQIQQTGIYSTSMAVAV
jgi:hypothetical protein